MGLFDDLLAPEERAGPPSSPGLFDDLLAPEERAGPDDVLDAPEPNQGVVLPSIKRVGGQFVESVGTTIEDITGENVVTRGLQDFGEGVVQANPSQIQSFGDILENPWTTIKEAVAEQLPQLGAAFTGARLGATAGGLVAGPPGAVVGSVIGGLAPIAIQEYGEIRGKQQETGEENIPLALGGATAATALERFGLDKFAIKAGAKGFGEVLDAIPDGTSRLAHAGKQLVKTGLVEGPGTEIPQTAIERYAGGQEIGTQEAFDEYALAGAKGAIGGGVIGGGLGLVAPREQAPSPQPSPARGEGEHAAKVDERTLTPGAAAPEATEQETTEDGWGDALTVEQRRHMASIGAEPGGGPPLPPAPPPLGPLGRAAEAGGITQAGQRLKAARDAETAAQAQVPGFVPTPLPDIQLNRPQELWGGAAQPSQPSADPAAGDIKTAQKSAAAPSADPLRFQKLNTARTEANARKYAEGLASQFPDHTFETVPHRLTKGKFAVKATPRVGALDQAAHEAATSPQNGKPEPTEAQKEAGNYQKGHVRYAGLDISIENPKGSKRSGVGPDGKPWEVEMSAHYGYIKRSNGNDGEQVDVYLGSEREDTPAFVVDQIDPKSGKFDEHKVLLGAATREEAEAVYDAHFSDGSGPSRRQAVSEVSVDDLKTWLADGNTKAEFAPQSGLLSNNQVVETSTKQPEQAVSDVVASNKEPGVVPGTPPGQTFDVSPPSATIDVPQTAALPEGEVDASRATEPQPPPQFAQRPPGGLPQGPGGSPGVTGPATEFPVSDNAGILPASADETGADAQALTPEIPPTPSLAQGEIASPGASAAVDSSPEGAKTPDPATAPQLPRGTVSGGAEEIGAVFDAVANQKPSLAKRAVRFAAVDEARAAAIKQRAGVDVAGYHHSIDNFAIRHALKEHGDPAQESTRGQEAITREDFLRLPDIVENYDTLESAGQDAKRAPLIRYTKRYDGQTYYVEEVRTKRKELAFKTLWKTRTTKTDAALARPPLLTSETLGRNPSQGEESVTVAQGGDKGRPAVVAEPETQPAEPETKATKAETTKATKADQPNREAERRFFALGADSAKLRDLALAGNLTEFTQAAKDELQAMQADLASMGTAEEGRALLAVDFDKLPDSFYRSLYKQARRLGIEANRDPEVYVSALQAAWKDAHETQGVDRDPKMALAFTEGFDHAIAGKTKSTIPQDLADVRQKGYDAARKWLATPEGRAFYTGKRGKKLENTGAELRRHWESRRQSLDEANASDIDAAIKAIENATVRADLFKPALGPDASPGLGRYLDAVRGLLYPFTDWLVHGANAPLRYSGRRSHGAKERLRGFLTSGGTASYSAEDKEAQQQYRLNEIKAEAQKYIDALTGLAQVLEGKQSVREGWAAMREYLSLPKEAGEIRAEKTDAWQTLLPFMRKPAELAYLLLESDAHFTKGHPFEYREGIADPAVTKATPLNRPKLDKITRYGLTDWRKGKSVTPQEFKEMFGFADVGFGKWVGGKQDQDHLNYAYDAFRDLAEFIGADPKAIGLGGTLHFTIGALGHGRHSAHYSTAHPHPDGGTVPVINVTNTRGDGTLAHEWHHALDYHLRTLPAAKRALEQIRQLLKTSYDLERARASLPRFFNGSSHFSSMRKDGPVANAKQAVRWYGKGEATDYYKKANALGRDYWGNDDELFARAGEAWVFDKLAGRDDYLVSDWVEEGKVKKPPYRGTPYPTGDERAAFGDAYRALFDSLDWKDDGPHLNAERWEEKRSRAAEEHEQAIEELREQVPEMYKQWRAEKRQKEEAQAKAEREAQVAAMLAERELQQTEAPGTPGPATDEELEELFDAVVAETRESLQEKPEAPTPGEVSVEAQPLDTTPVAVQETPKGETQPAALSDAQRKAFLHVIRQQHESGMRWEDIAKKITPPDVPLAAVDALVEEERSKEKPEAVAPTLGPFAFKPGHRVLFRGASPDTRGTWFTTDFDYALKFAKNKDGGYVLAIQIPIVDAEKHKTPNQHYILPEALAREAVKWPEAMQYKTESERQNEELRAKAKSGAAAKKTAAHLIKEAAKLGVKGIDEALSGLADIFGAGKIQSFPGGFNEDDYARAKPKFEAALKAFQEAGRTLKDLFKLLVHTFGEGIKPYALRFAKEKGLSTQGNLKGEQDGLQGSRRERPEGQEPEGLRPDEGRGDVGDVPGGTGGRVRPGGAEADEGGDRPGADGALPGEDAGDRDGEATGAGSPGKSTRGAAKRASRGLTGTNYRITPTDEIGTGGWKTRARQNIEAIKIVKALAAETRLATHEEQQKLVKYVGWGASELANGIFDNYGYYKDGWADLGAELKELLSADEYKAARASTLNAHYTSPAVIGGIYQALEKFGFKGGRILEPGAGIGHFIGLRPDGLAQNTRYTAVELDPISAAIAKALYPREDVRAQDFTDFLMPKGFFDVVIGNPPFADIKILKDKEYARFGYKLHDYMIVKSMDRLRAGGVMALVTSRYTLDKGGMGARLQIMKQADLIGAVRLPQTAFKENAGTEVVTDVLFFRKRLPGEEKAGEAWSKIVEVQTQEGPAHINEYYVAHPEMVLGEHRLVGSMYSDKEYTVIPFPGDLDDALRRAVARLPANIYTETTQEKTPEQSPDADLNPATIKENAYYLKDGVIHQRHSGVGVPRTKLSAKHAAIIKRFVPLRDAGLKVLQVQMDKAASEADLQAAQKVLGKAYDAFVKDFGPVNKEIVRGFTDIKGVERESVRNPNIEPFKSDPDAYRVASFEKLNRKTGKGTKAAIFTERVISPQSAPKIEGPTDALHVTVAETGRVDMKRAAELAGLTEAETIAALGDEIYQNPEAGAWESAADYLSGPVRQKLKYAEAAALADPQYQRNVEALRGAQPEDQPPSKIDMAFGMPILRTADIEDFCREVMGIGVTAKHVPEFAAWSVHAERYSHNSIAATSTWGTPRFNAVDLIDAALNKKSVKVFDYVDKKPVLNAEATEAANEKLARIKERFGPWIWEDGARAEHYVRSYNDTYNDSVKRDFGGPHIDYMRFPGVSTKIKPALHQKRVAYRIIQRGNTYMAHEVGTGKTIGSILAGMELKRLGIKKKPMWVVPNHMLKQFATEFLELYPAAKILVADEENFSATERNRFMGRIAAENWDGIIITHSAFGKIPLSEAYQRGFLEMFIAKLEEMLAAAQGDRLKTKQIERAKKRLEQRLAKILSGADRDRGVGFEETGVDQLFVDEAQEFRKIDFVTNMSDIKGIDPAGSAMAFDLYNKSRYLESLHPGRSLVLLSGTPITNTLGEAYSIQRLLQPEALKSRGIDNFDAWAATFGDTVTKLEPDPAGDYRTVTRFAEFRNSAQLSSLFGEVCDAIFARDVPQAPGRERPKVKGGQRRMVLGEMTPLQIDYQDRIKERLRKIKERKGPPQKGDDIILSVITDGQHAAIDQRFIDPQAGADPSSKIELMINNVVELWEKHKDARLTQMIFNDLGTPAAEEKRGWSSYNYIRDTLIKRGIPAKEIAFMQDYKKNDAKKKLFDAVNRGDVRVLIGSSQAMGTGVNAQRLLVALHHLDPDRYLPAWITQREGRIIRQGNANKDVEIYAYATKGPSDEAMWGTLERKQRFIDDFLQGQATGRTEDMDGGADLFALSRALSSRDPRVMELASLEGDLQRLERLAAAHADDQVRMRRIIHNNKDHIRFREEHNKNIREALKEVTDTRGDKFTAEVLGKTYTGRKEAGEALLAHLKAEVAKVKKDGLRELPDVVGKVAGLRIKASFRRFGAPGDYTYYAGLQLASSSKVLEGSMGDMSEVDLEEKDPSQLMQGLEAKSRVFESWIPDNDKRIAEYQQENKDAEARLGLPFEKAAELKEKSAKAQELKAALKVEDDDHGAAPDDSADDDSGVRHSYLGWRAAAADFSALVAAREYAEQGIPMEEIRKSTGWFRGPDSRWRFEIADKKARLKLDWDGYDNTVGDALDHAVLFENYPSLAKIGLVFRFDLPDKVSGGYAPTDNAIHLNANLSPADAKSTLLHELQHAVQLIEGFARGGSPTDTEFMKTAASMGIDTSDKSAMVAAYMRLLGEVEARDVQARMDLTAEELLARPPYVSQGIPESDFIVQHEGEFAASMSSQKPGPAGLSVSRVEETLVGRFGSGVRRLIQAKTLRIRQHESELPPHLNNGKGGIRAVYDPKGDPLTGKGANTVWMVGDNLSVAETPGVFLHDLGIHYGLERMIGSDKYRDIIRQIKALELLGNEAVRAGRAAIPEGTRKSAVDDELLAYLVEKHPELPLVKRIIAAIRAFLFRHGLIKNIRPEDVVALAKAAARHAARGVVMNRAAGVVGAPLVGAQYSGSPLWYSEMAKFIDAKAPGKAPAALWKGLLDSWAKAGKFKGDELEWSGVKEWLTLATPEGLPWIVTKEDVLGFIRENGVRVEETVLGERAKLTPEEQEEFNRLDWGSHDLSTPEGARWDALKRKRGWWPVKFEQWQLPGGENYRELLLRLPEQAVSQVRIDTSGWRVVAKKGNDFTGQRDISIRDAADAEVGLRYGFRGTDAEAIAEHAATLEKSRTFEAKKEAQFRSSHFDEPNILAHVRFNERVDADGKRVLFIEEIQSDWAQKGKKQGFHGEEKVVPFGDKWRVQWDANATTFSAPVATREEAQLVVDNARSGIPSAPFVAKTEAWVALALKRMIRYAAENEFDRMAWTTGEQQANRYPEALRKVIDEITWSTEPSGKRVIGNKGGRTVFFAMVDDKGTISRSSTNEGALNGKNAADVFGKDMAPKILGEPKGSISGIDFNVGGQGMRAFYNQIVPNVANALLKKLGGGRVGTVSIDRAGKDDLIPVSGEQPGFDLTPALRDSAMRGLPLFSREADIARGQAAMDRVIRNRGDEMEAMERGGLGKIAFLWGNAGRLDARKGRYVEGGGVAHIIAQRDLEGKDGKATARAMPDVIARGDVGPVYGPPGGERVNIHHQGKTAVLSLYHFRQERTWLLTGWEEGPGGAEGVNPNDTYAPSPSGIQAEEGAGPKSTIEPAGGPVKGPQGPLFSRATPPDPNTPEGSAAAVDRIGEAMRTTRHGWEAIKSKMLKDWRPAWLGLFTRRQLVDIGEGMVPALGNYNRAVEAMDADRNRFDDEAHVVAEAAAAYVKSHKKEADVLFDLMHAATLSGVDPALDYRPSIFRQEAYKEIASLKRRMRTRPGEADLLQAQIDEIRTRLDNEKVRKLAYPGLQKRYTGLSEDARSVYSQMRDLYSKRFDEREAALIQRIKDAEADERWKSRLIADIRRRFETARLLAPYFPLVRFGDYWIAATNPDGEREFHLRESEHQQQALRTELEAGGYRAIEHGFKMDKLFEQQGASAGFVSQIIKVIDSRAGPRSSPALERIKDEIYQIYLHTLPEMSARRHWIHRQKTPGFSQDALRGFAKQMFHGNRQLARLRQESAMEKALSRMRKQANAAADPNRAAHLVNEMQKRDAWIKNPTTATWANVAGGFGFLWYLTAPASAIVNVTQTPLVAYPLLAARHGWGAAAKALTGAMGDYFRGRFSVEGALKGEDLAAYRRFLADGLIDKTQSHDLAGMSETPSAIYSGRTAKVMRAASFLFHRAERANREITALAAFRLARAKGLGVDAAYQEAKGLTWEAHFDYSNANKARFIQGDVPRVLFMFKQFSQHMTYLMARSAHQSIKGLTGAARREARLRLSGILGMHALFAGALGMPLMGTLAMVMNALFDDEDEPYDFDLEFRNFLAEAFGPEIGQAIARGPVESLTGLGVAHRVGLSDLWFREPDKTLEGRGLVEYWTEQLLGPLGGVALKAGTAYEMFQDGHTARALESMTPTAITSGLRMLRYAGEGVQSLRGDPVMEEVSTWNLLSQAAGFSPAELGQKYDANRAIKDLEFRILDRRERLINRWWLARRTGDMEGVQEAMAEIRRFNESTSIRQNPRARITPATLLASTQARRRYSRRAEGGIIVDQRLARLPEQVRFAP